MDQHVFGLLEFGKDKFGKDVFKTNMYNEETLKYQPRFSDATKALVESVQGDAFVLETYDTTRRTDPDFEAYEFVHYKEAVEDYGSYPSEENSKRVAGHSFRQRVYGNDAFSRKCHVDLYTQILTKRGGVMGIY